MSAQNLLPLLDQLQLMENSLINFMFETILKLKSLTDSKVFLLLENSNKRRYCGSTELVDSFETRGLPSHATDVRVELDTSAYVLIERPCRKRPHLPIVDGSSVPLPPPYTPEVPSSYAVSEAKKRRVADFADNFGNLKKEMCLATQSVPEYVISDTEEDGDPVAEEMESMNYEQWAPVPRQKAPAFTPSLTGTEGPAAFFSALPDPELEARKLGAVLSIENPWAAYEKGTTENKLLKSVLYSVGKNIALSCPYADLRDTNAQAFFMQQSDLFVSQCSALVVDKNETGNRPPEVADCLKGYSVGGFMRRCIRDGFKRVAASRKSKS